MSIPAKKEPTYKQGGGGGGDPRGSSGSGFEEDADILVPVPGCAGDPAEGGRRPACGPTRDPRGSRVALLHRVMLSHIGLILKFRY